MGTHMKDRTPPSVKRKIQVNAVFSEAEAQAIEAQARKQGVTRSRWLHELAIAAVRDSLAAGSSKAQSIPTMRRYTPRVAAQTTRLASESKKMRGNPDPRRVTG